MYKHEVESRKHDTYTLYADPMLAQRLRRWPNIESAQDITPILFQCWASVADDGPTLKQHWVKVSRWLG